MINFVTSTDTIRRAFGNHRYLRNACLWGASSCACKNIVLKI